VYSLSFTNPYFTLDGISLGYDLYRRDVDAGELDDVSAYETSTKGVGARLGLPINERDTIAFGLTYEDTSLTIYSDDDPLNQSIQERFVEEFGEDNDTLRLDVSWARDSRNSFLFPTTGIFQRVAAEIGTPAGSLQYYKLSLQHQQFFALGRDFTLMLNAEAGIGDGLNDKPLPFFKNFYAGGTTSVRGFKAGTLGPKDLYGDALGGDTRLVGNAELIFPLPGLKDDQSLRMSAFIDAGAVWGPSDGNPLNPYNGMFENFAFDDLRYSAGVAVLWVSPMGPLKFSLAQPLVEKDGDETEIFQFTMGNVF
jgi:outer membrane protein insertion porin family